MKKWHCLVTSPSIGSGVAMGISGAAMWGSLRDHCELCNRKMIYVKNDVFVLRKEVHRKNYIETNL